MGAQAIYIEQIDSDIFDLAKKYIVKTKSRCKDLRLALESQDIAKASRLIHSLKGTSGSYGFMSLYELAKDLEVLIHKKQWEEAISQYSYIEVYFKKVKLSPQEVD